MPAVSIIVPVYNVEQYLEECLDSILNQTYQDFELILVDDGSKDNSGAICDRYQNDHSIIKVIHQENQGQAAARNHGVEISQGEWIMFVDSDDVIHPQLLEYLINAVETSGANSSACYIHRGDNITNMFYAKRKMHSEVMVIDDDNIVSLFQNRIEKENDVLWLILPKLWKATIVKNNPFVCGRIYEDNEVACKWLVESKNIAIISEEMYFYRNNPHSTMNSAFSSKSLDYLWALESMLLFFYEVGYKKSLKFVFDSYFNTAVYYSKRILQELNDTKLNKQLMTETRKKIKEFSNFCTFKLNPYTYNYILKYSRPNLFRVKKAISSFKRIIH